MEKGNGELLLGLSDQDYNDINAIRASEIKCGTTSMKCMRHAATVQRTQTEAMRMGSLFHAVMADPSQLDDPAVWEKTRRGKAWDEFKQLHDDKLVLVPKEFDLLKRQVDAVMGNPNAQSIINRIEEREVTAIWNDGYPAKAKFDAAGQGFLVDFKTSSVVTPSLFLQRAENLGYLMQLGWYAHGWHCCAEEHFGKLKRAYLICVQSNNEMDVVVYNVETKLMHEAYNRKDGGAKQIADNYAACCHLGLFPGVADDMVQEFERPAWAVHNEKTELLIGGKQMEV